MPYGCKSDSWASEFSHILRTSFATAFTGCQFLSEFNSKCVHLFIVPCMVWHHPIYLHSSITRPYLNVDPVCDLDHVQIWLSPDIVRSSLRKPSPLQALYYGTDCLKILGHLHRFPSFTRDSMKTCLTSNINFVHCLRGSPTSLRRYIIAQFVLSFVLYCMVPISTILYQYF